MARVLLIAFCLISAVPAAAQPPSDTTSEGEMVKSTVTNPSAPQSQPQTPADPQHRNESQGIMSPRATGGDANIDKYHFFGSLKVRIEDTNYFSSKKANGDYVYGGSLLRFGVRRETRTDDFLMELAIPTLYNVPTRASGPSPQGTLGQGASYFNANGGQVASLFPKQLYERFKNIGDKSNSLRVGRFEFIDGAEVRSTDSSIAYLKQNRIANRLISPNPFSYIGHSYDGFEFTNHTGDHTITAFAALPTRGSYDLKGSDELTNIKIAYLAGTLPRVLKVRNSTMVSDSRAFGIFYEDTRGSQVVKVDNRPAAARQRDWGAIDIGTIGGHDVRVFPVGTGKMDTLLWTAAQFGKWGEMNHGAYAYDAELGYQPRDAHLKPWYRLGYYFGSGDGNGSNNQHGTFFPMLPSGHTYARFPFFSTSNLRDAFAEVVLRPSSRMVIRTDVRKLGLANGHDLYYSGSGAYDNSTFGYTGRTSSNSTDLAMLYDTSIDFQMNKTTLFIFYAGYAHGGAVLSSIYNGRDAAFTYLELQKRF